jgi:hypothetical protein
MMSRARQLESDLAQLRSESSVRIRQLEDELVAARARADQWAKTAAEVTRQQTVATGPVALPDTATPPRDAARPLTLSLLALSAGRGTDAVSGPRAAVNVASPGSGGLTEAGSPDLKRRLQLVRRWLAVAHIWTYTDMTV